MVKVIKLDQEIIEILIISIHSSAFILKSPFTYMVYRQFSAFFKSFGKISPNSPSSL